MTYFKDLDIEPFKGSQVILDIDGTLLADGAMDIGREEEGVLRRIKEISTVYLFSNGAKERSANFAMKYDVSYIDSDYKKPSTQVAKGIPDSPRRFVVGDKVLTDGLLALSIGATFIQVARIVSTHASRSVQLIDGVDTLLSPLIRPLLPFLHYPRMLRPYHWIKNLLVFAPLFFAGQFLSIALFKNGIIAFIAFCLVSSVVYVMNDLMDRAADAKHPTKRFRPLPTGSVSVLGTLLFEGILLLLVLLVLSFLPTLIPYLVFYLVANITYSLFLKHIAALDIVVVASFYVLRVVVGGVAVSVLVSPWILLATFFLALFLITGKRRAESLHEHKRKVLEGYAKETLDSLLVGSALLAIITYSTWVIITHPTLITMVSVMVAVAAIFRAMNMLFLKPSYGEAPEAIFLKDKWIFICAFVWGFLMFATFYA